MLNSWRIADVATISVDRNELSYALPKYKNHPTAGVANICKLAHGSVDGLDNCLLQIDTTPEEIVHSND